MKIRSCKNLLLLLLVTGCNSQNRVDNSNKELANEIKQSQIKRVTNEQVISAIDLWGKELVRKAQEALVKEINAAKQPTSPLCEDLSKLPIIAAYETEYGISMGFLTPADSSNLGLDSKEKELLAAYQYSAQKKLPLNDNIQKLNDTLYVYNAAMAETQIANSCFPEQDFVLWRIIFDKRKVIQKIDIKKI